MGSHPRPMQKKGGQTVHKWLAFSIVRLNGPPQVPRNFTKVGNLRPLYTLL